MHLIVKVIEFLYLLVLQFVIFIEIMQKHHFLISYFLINLLTFYLVNNYFLYDFDLILVLIFVSDLHFILISFKILDIVLICFKIFGILI
jgi:hypothetical protein